MCFGTTTTTPAVEPGTVAALIEQLQELPKDAKVHAYDGSRSSGLPQFVNAELRPSCSGEYVRLSFGS